MVKICSLGAASQDVFISGKGVRSKLDPKTNEYFEEFRLGAKLNVDNVVFSTGGGATNAAVTFARQNLTSSFIGKIGKDITASAVIAALDEENVDSSLVIVDKVLGTQYSTILLTESGERTILIYRGAANSHTVKDYEHIDFSGYDWLYVSSFGGAMDALSTIFKNAHEAGVKIAFNPGDGELQQANKLRSLLEDVNVLCMNKEEMQMIVHGETSEELVRHALNLVSVVVVSDGPNGVVASDGKTIVKAGMYEDVKVVDRTGAGDAFASGFLSQWVRGASLKESVIFASANSTSVVGQLGAKSGILEAGVRLHDMPIHETKL